MLPPIGDGEDPAGLADLLAGLDGEVGFVQGGQLVDHPRRHLVPLAAAQRAATDFLRTGTIEPDGWEPQP